MGASCAWEFNSQFLPESPESRINAGIMTGITGIQNFIFARTGVQNPEDLTKPLRGRGMEILPSVTGR
jgi:hypothetical protein